MRNRVLIILLLIVAAGVAAGFFWWRSAGRHAAKPQAPITQIVGNGPASFNEAKRILQTRVYADHRVEFYCGCSYSPDKKIDAGTCGLQARENGERALRVEWEHVVPAAWMGQGRSCWKEGAPQCVENGKAFKGRKCCEIADPEFSRMEADLHNLVPAGGEMNGDRRDYAYGTVAGEPREYGRCDFEVDRKAKIAEVSDDHRGAVARITLYMMDRYDLQTPYQRSTLEQWSAEHPADAWEIEQPTLS